MKTLIAFMKLVTLFVVSVIVIALLSLPCIGITLVYLNK